MWDKAGQCPLIQVIAHAEQDPLPVCVAAVLPGPAAEAPVAAAVVHLLSMLAAVAAAGLLAHELVQLQVRQTLLPQVQLRLQQLHCGHLLRAASQCLLPGSHQLIACQPNLLQRCCQHQLQVRVAAVAAADTVCWC